MYSFYIISRAEEEADEPAISLTLQNNTALAMADTPQAFLLPLYEEQVTIDILSCL
jgi:hypothetical protein